jgi:aspartate/tyrosine/aromatic aminotransferase
MPPRAVVVLHVSAHNPTGCDLSKEQWNLILAVIKKRNLFPFFDFAYQGFANGDPESDAYAIRKAHALAIEMFVAHSFSKNFGLYGQRAGALHFTGANSSAVLAHLSTLIRAHYSTSPSFGAKIVAEILTTPQLKQQWLTDLRVMSTRINSMRSSLYLHLKDLRTPGNWEHIPKQVGMFCYTRLNASTCEQLDKQYSVYMPTDGRLSLSGLNEHNVKYLADAIDRLLRS